MPIDGGRKSRAENTGRKTDFSFFSASRHQGAQATNNDHIQKLLLELGFPCHRNVGQESLSFSHDTKKNAPSSFATRCGAWHHVDHPHCVTWIFTQNYNQYTIFSPLLAMQLCILFGKLLNKVAILPFSMLSRVFMTVS